ncbi:MAG: type III-A CRISPR-associated RAMP protein Csm3 [Planctomycetota bacterium]|nr:MAG: type III-A CRISPR-associated RAMP protein Csm3 [Planctomycetota bacterium]
MSATRLLGTKLVTGCLVVETGLRIGGSQEMMEIGGLDNPIIRNPASGEPFIPGSSIRGRMRSLAEWYFDELPRDGDVTKPQLRSRTARVFGRPAQDPKKARGDDAAALTIGPTRLIVRDASLSRTSREEFARGRPITEVKSENSINRLTAMANPRPMERVLPGVRFDCEFVYRIFDVDGDNGEEDKRLFEEVFLVALSLLQADALGGGSSRGNGKIRLELTLDGSPLELPTPEFAGP